MRVTIKDIASMAGVSVSTVSRALNKKTGMDDATRGRILQISEQLGYRPSAFARGLVLRQTKTLMVLVPDLANYYFAEVTQEISTVCRKRGYKVLLGSTGNSAPLEREYLETIREGAVDGAIIVPQLAESNLDIYLELVRMDFPVVLIDRTFDRFKFASVVVDNRLGAAKAVLYLAEKGHKRIAFVGGDIDLVHATRDRYAGYVQALRELGLPLRDELVLLGRPSPDKGGAEAMEQILSLEEPPTAVFADNDLTAFACIGTAHRCGKRVPDDIAVVGFDNINISPFFDVPLTTVAQPKRAIAEGALGLVLDLIGHSKGSGEGGNGIGEVVVEPELIIRASA